MAVENRYQIEVNMKSRMFREVPEVVANDKVIFEITVYDGPQKFPLSETYTYHLTSLKLGGQSVIREGTLSGEVIVFELGTSEMTVPGKVEGTVQIFDENNDRISSSKFDYVVKRDPSLQGSLPADNTSLIIANESLLTSAVEKSDTAITDSSTALTKATAAETTANQVKSEFDQVVAEAGSNNPEVVQARGEFVNLKARIDHTDEVLAENMTEIEEVSNKTYGKTTRPVKNIVSLYIDDAAPEDLTLVKPITDSKGVPVTIAAISNSVINKNPWSMTIEQLQQLQLEGWEINSHTHNHVDLSTKTEAEIDEQMRLSKEYFESNGLSCKSICYPYGYYNDTVLKVARKYYRAGLGSEQGVESTPINTYNTYRLNFDAYDITTLKQKIDALNNQWLIIYTHSQMWVTDNKVEENKVKLAELIDYIKSKNIEITTVDKALDTFENLLDIGDSTTNYLKVGADGKVEQKPIVPSAFLSHDIGIKVNTPVTAFEKYKTTLTAFRSIDNFGLTGFPLMSGAGTLLTFRPHLDDSLSSQVFYTAENQYVLRRTWNTGTSSWNAFKVVSPLTIRKEVYIDSVLANGSRVYSYSVPGLRALEPVTVTFEGELETGLIYTANVVEEGRLNFKIYNVTGAQIPVGVKYLRIVQY